MSPLILALDTTGEHGSLALVRGEELLEELAMHSPTGFSHILYGELSGLLTRHGVSVKDVDCFAAASGPGSFTGVRVGLACVKGLAAALARPAVAVSNLEALARCGTAPLRAAVIDARRDQVYGAVYAADGMQVSPEVVSSIEPWLRSLPTEVDEFVTAMPLPVAHIVAAPEALAGVIARIACDRLLRGQACDPAALDANYVRRSDAELFWRDPK